MRLYGDIKRFGREYDFDVTTVGEIFRALCSQLPGFRQAMAPNHYRVRVGKRYLQAEQLDKGMAQSVFKDEVIHIVPVASGAKSGWGIFGIVAGVALIATAWFNPFGWAAATQLAIGAAGAGLALGGVAMMLTPMPETPGVSDESDSSRNTSFSNLSNMLPQGRPVPLAYGEVYTGSLVISQGLYSE